MKFNLEEKKPEILEVVRSLIPDIDTVSLEAKYDTFSKNFGGKATDEMIYDRFIFDSLYDSGTLHIVDWKWEFDDILQSLSDISEKVPYEVIEEVHNDDTGEVSGTIKIKDGEYSFEGEYQEGFTEVVNDALEEQKIDSRLFIVDMYRGDNFEFVVVPKDTYDSLTCSDFLPFGSC